MRVLGPGRLEGIRKFQAGKPSMYVRFQTAGPLRGFCSWAQRAEAHSILLVKIATRSNSALSLPTPL